MVGIKDMEMPNCCRQYEYTPKDCSYCLRLHQPIQRNIFDTSRHPNCPLTEIEERKVGKWINKTHKSGCGISFVASECTCCGKKTLFNCDELLYNYCPNCGAKMDKE